MTDPSTAPPARLFTAFGSVLYVDGATGELRHGPIETTPANAYLVADQGAAPPYRQGWLTYDSGDAHEPIVCTSESCGPASRVKERGSRTPTLLELVALERGLITLTASNAFLSAIPDGRVQLRAPRCSTWELFFASEDWCSDAPAFGAAESLDISPAGFDKKAIERYPPHPMIRARANRKPKRGKLLIYGRQKGSRGRLYYDLCKHLHRQGYLVDTLDWDLDHGAYIYEIIPYYDLFMTACDGVGTLVDHYDIPYQRIIAVSHHEFDIRNLIERKGVEVFNKFANFGVVNEFLYSASLMLGVPKAPMVASLGVNYSEFYGTVSERLTTVGYAGSISAKTYGVDWKRRELAEAAARDAGLAFKAAGSTGNQISFHDMPDFYQTVDAVLTTSFSEGAELPAMEGAAAGKLVISTPVGHFPRNQSGGIIAPIEDEKFKAFTANTLRYYKENPQAYAAKCREIQNAARQFDWQNSISEWVELIEGATGDRNSTTKAERTCSTGEELSAAQPALTNEQRAEDVSQPSAPEGQSSHVRRSKKGIICDIDWLSGYICNEHYYLMKLLEKEYGFDIINSKTTFFQSADVIDKLNTYDAVILYAGYVDIPVERLSSYKIVKVDDLVNYDKGFDKFLHRLVNNANMVISPYAYAVHRHFYHNNIVWLPYSSGVEAFPDVPFNEVPIRKVLVLGSVAWDRPLRQYAASRKSEHIEVLNHPGYGKRYYTSYETGGHKYFSELGRYLCCFCDAHKYRYMHPKIFEIASIGSLLLADKLIEKEMNELGFIDYKTCIFTDKESFLEKVSWICDDKNRADVERIRRAGMELARARHLTRHRAKQLNHIVNNAIERLTARRAD